MYIFKKKKCDIYILLNMLYLYFKNIIIYGWMDG